MKKYYITSAIPYVNAKPHIGHALEFVQSDVIARFHKIMGDDVLLLCGSDENAIKNVQAAETVKIPIQEFVDMNAKLFEKLAQKLSVSFDIFQKGSSQMHHLSSQELWTKCYNSGDIYKKQYQGLYCMGCELFYEPDELNEQGECYEHPGKKLEKVTEENYFFRLSKYQQQIESLLDSNTLHITPQSRKNEILSFVKQGLKDISISRSNTRAKNWGVTVPNDESQKMYVWFDALNIYQSGIGFGSDEKTYLKWWPADLHVIGKGIIRFHAVYWPAFLLSAGIPLPKAIFSDGYLTVNGQKMSKTIGNVIDPNTLIDAYGTDAIRYYLLREIPSTADGDFSEHRLKEIYTADLANGLGNLVSRIAKLCETSNYIQQGSEKRISGHLINVETYTEAMYSYRFNDALSVIWKKITILDKYINQEKPWALLKDKNEKNTAKIHGILSHAVDELQEIAALLEPFLPETAKEIEDQFKDPSINAKRPLFPRIV